MELTLWPRTGRNRRRGVPERVSLLIYPRARHEHFGWPTSPAIEKWGAEEEPWRPGGVGGRILGG